jgi:uncharacterized protein YdhG (YjbR/CyaY superfamily)
MTATTKPAKTATTEAKSYDGFTEAERGAMKDRAKELKAAARRPRGAKVDTEAEVLAKLAEMAESDRVIGERLHAIIKSSAPSLSAKLWYGMPAYAQDGKIVCHFQPADKFKTRYGMLCFSDAANLDDGAIWATSFAVPELTAAGEKKIAALVKQATR